MKTEKSSNALLIELVIVLFFFILRSRFLRR